MLSKNALSKHFTIPEHLILDETSTYLLKNGFKLLHIGKVRNTFSIPGDKNNLLVVATDRASIFDFVLNTTIPNKGAILTLLTVFWAAKQPSVKTHLVPCASKRKKYNAAYDLKQKYPGIDVSRCLVVKNLRKRIDPAELIFRAHLGGSVFSDYQQTGIVAGQTLPKNITKWSKLDSILFTPSTKENAGHDLNITAQAYYEAMGEKGKSFVRQLSEFYKNSYTYALKCGIIILDAKFEGSSEYGIIADEILTCDSARFTDEKDFADAMKKGLDPKPIDKQVLRDWGNSLTIDAFGCKSWKELDPSNGAHCAYVHSIEVPKDIVQQVSATYEKLWQRLDFRNIKEAQEHYLGFKN